MMSSLCRYLEVDNSALFYKLREVLATNSLLACQEERWPMADLTTSKKTLKAVAYLKPNPVNIEPYLTRQELIEWQGRMQQKLFLLNDQVADMLDVVFHIWLREANSHETLVTVTADDFLRLRGLKPQKSGTGRRGGYKKEWREEAARYLDVLANTWITVAEMDTIEITAGKKGPYRRLVKWRGESPVIVVTEFDSYVWQVRPGDVFAKFLFGPGRQTALLSIKALEFDPYRRKWEKRLTRYLSWQWRNRQGKRRMAGHVQKRNS